VASANETEIQLAFNQVNAIPSKAVNLDSKAATHARYTRSSECKKRVKHHQAFWRAAWREWNVWGWVNITLQPGFEFVMLCVCRCLSLHARTMVYLWSCECAAVAVAVAVAVAAATPRE
jgi:hypothetical protein